MLKKKLNDRFRCTQIGNILDVYRIRKAYRRWVNKGKPMPVPHDVKKITVKSFAKQYGIRVFVETGTYLGDMVAAVNTDFDIIYSIELSEDLYKQAMKRFAGYKHITIIQGDSAKVISEILRRIKVPSLFWLDGHYSAGITARGEKDTPIWEELNHICDHPIKNHVILIDDARQFIGDNDYPTLESLQKFVKSRFTGYIFEVREDIIRIYK